MSKLSEEFVTAYTQDVTPECNWVSLDDFVRIKKIMDESIAELEQELQQCLDCCKRVGELEQELTEADKDHKDMRRFQRKFIRADHENRRLREGIQDYLAGNYECPHAHTLGSGKCSHGVDYYCECAQCDAAHFQALLAEGG